MVRLFGCPKLKMMVVLCAVGAKVVAWYSSHPEEPMVPQILPDILSDGADKKKGNLTIKADWIDGVPKKKSVVRKTAIVVADGT